MKEHPYQHNPDNVPSSLAQIPFFQDLDKGAVDDILANSTLLEVEQGEVIMQEGSEDRALHILLKGKVHIVKDGKTIAAIGRAGELVGELALISDEGRSASVVAALPVYCLKIDPSALAGLSAADRNAYYAAVYRFLARLLAKRLATTSEKLVAAERHAEELQARLNDEI